ncbi:MAG: tripartite tricarboxylate transporter substrate binding protein [Betaproteobacteria bacterium]|nr:tripartite tricarboxylate transporter substrate binding protein [Betaproteobacteria bacterium]
MPARRCAHGFHGAFADCALHLYCFRIKVPQRSIGQAADGLRFDPKKVLISIPPRGEEITMLARSMSSIVFAAVALLAAAAATHAAEIAYPTKPIRLIVPFPPGGSADPLARTYGAWLSDKFGVPVVCDNRPGAGTAIAHTLGAKAAPDGYTLLLGASSGMTTNPASGAKLDYDSVKDFAHVGLAAYVPQLIVVHPSVPAKSFPELIELAKTPGKANFGTPGFGSLGHLTVAFLNVATGAKFTHVPYKGAGPAMIDLLASRIQVFVGSVTGTQAQVRAGKAHAIVTGHATRVSSFPDVPTISEFIPGFTNNGWYGIVAPAGTPEAIVDKLNAEMKRALADAEFVKHVEALGMEPVGSTPQELREWTRSELARWTKVVKDAGVKIQ